MLFDVSAVTIQVNTAALAEAGALRRTRGAAMLPARTLSLESSLASMPEHVTQSDAIYTALS